MANVLIIDDDHDVTRLLETHLTEEGHTVTVTHDGKEGLSQVLKNVPDLIMLDVFLPDATGYQMCNRIRKNEATKETPIILMTGAARFPNQQMYGRQRGANEYIFKPFDIVQVGELVRKYIPVSVGTSRNAPAPQSVSQPEAVEPAAPPVVPQKPEPVVKQSHLAALTAFLKRNGATTPKTVPVETEVPVEAVDVEPGIIELKVDETPVVEAQAEMDTTPPAPEPDPVPAPPIEAGSEPLPQVVMGIPPARDGYVANSFSDTERVINFSMDVYALTSRLNASHTEKFLADQLLRASLSVGVKLNAAQFSASPEEFLQAAGGALRDLRETAYWLMITRRAGVLDKLSKLDLEKDCESLIALLADYANPKKP